MTVYNQDELQQPWMQQQPQQQPAAAQPAPVDWGAIEQQLRAKGGNLYDPSDLEGIQRNTSYTDAAGNSTGMTVDQALANQSNIYGQRAATGQSGGGQQQAQQQQTPAQQWNAQPSMASQPAGGGQQEQNPLYKLLLERASQGTAVSRNDPNIRAQVDPVVAQQERASRNYIDDIAERSGSLANITGERRLAAERGGQAAGAFESEVIGREIAGRRDEVAQSLQLAVQYGLTDQAQQLQRELAQLDATLQREGFGVQREGLGVQREGLALQRYGIDRQDDQFNRKLALDEYDTTNKWDFNWAGLGG